MNESDRAELGHPSDHQGSYTRFFAMLATSMVAMFVLMYLNSYQILDHAWFSETRLFMTLIMGAAMMTVMLAFMLGMYRNRAANIAIFVGAGLLLLCALWLVRSQATVTGVDYMEGMIPHHSIAILTSERAGIEDLRVRKLADGIIDAQRREIKEMEWLIADIRAHGTAVTEEEAKARAVPDFSGTPE
jgi:FlaA1/EpsC-like NDP-sugar epimerase